MIFFWKRSSTKHRSIQLCWKDAKKRDPILRMRKPCGCLGTPKYLPMWSRQGASFCDAWFIRKPLLIGSWSRKDDMKRDPAQKDVLLKAGVRIIEKSRVVGECSRNCVDKICWLVG